MNKIDSRNMGRWQNSEQLLLADIKTIAYKATYLPKQILKYIRIIVRKKLHIQGVIFTQYHRTNADLHLKTFLDKLKIKPKRLERKIERCILYLCKTNDKKICQMLRSNITKNCNITCPKILQSHRA